MLSRSNILIVDDHPVFRKGLKLILRKSDCFNKILEAENGKEAIEVINAEEVDIVMMDIDMPEMNGIDATKAILKRKPDIKIIALTMFCEPRKIYDMCESGAKGYLLKEAHINEIIKAINMILNNEEYYCAKVQTILTEVYQDFDKRIKRKVEITKREEEILKLLCNQHSSEEIASLLNISFNTVRRHRQDLIDRTGSVNLAGLIIYAIEHQIFKVTIR